jgi:hypothetical protein
MNENRPFLIPAYQRYLDTISIMAYLSQRINYIPKQKNVLVIYQGKAIVENLAILKMPLVAKDIVAKKKERGGRGT